MAASEQAVLGLAQISKIFEATRDARQIPGNLLFRQRVNKVPATDFDIVARFLNEGHIADVVADDQKAVTYKAGRIKFESNLIPNFKLGRSVLQEDIKRLEFIANNRPANAAVLGDIGYFTRIAENLLLGLEWREESILVGMEIDAFTYSLNDITFTISWGMPAELKVTAATAWATAATATPMADILTQKYIRDVKYGRVTNRVKMSTPAFQLIPKTTEFQNQMRNFFLNMNQPTPDLPYRSLDAMKGLVGQVLGMTIELYDQRYQTQPSDGGATTYTPFLPLNKVILDDSGNDRNNAAKDFADGIVTESTLASPNTVFALRGGPQRGPYTYITVPPDLNPPNYTFWAVERGMPRKYDEALTSVIDVGTVTDTIAQGIAF